MKRWMSLEAGSDWDGPSSITVDVDRAAESIAREQGRLFVSLPVAEQDELRRIAIAALEGVGAE